MKNLNFWTILLTIIGVIGCQQPAKNQAEKGLYDAKIDSLMQLMTLEEKIGQLNLPTAGDFVTGLAKSTGVVAKIKKGQVGGLFNIRGVENIRAVQKVAIEESRLGIPLLFGLDVIHGYKTVFPIPLGMSASWNIDLIQRSSKIAATEATADGLAWTFSPMVDICRDPRWGRISEGVGEDAYLGAQISAAMVTGYQGDDLTLPNTMMSCVKHFALYGASEAGRDYNTVDMSRLRMYNEYLDPYKAAVDAGVGSVMASFNVIDGVPATGNQWLLTELLREEWGFNGFVVSDYTGVTEMIPHGMGDTTEVAALALNAGNDMDMVSEAMLNKLAIAVQRGLVSEAKIDEACRRILEAKYKLGLFDDPFRYCDTSRSDQIYSDAHRNEARKMASETFVLLKNDQNILPLAKEGTIALIGPMADNGVNMQGTWSVSGDHGTTQSLKSALEQVAGPNVKVLHARGANFVSDPALEQKIGMFGKDTKRDRRSDAEMIAEALKVASQADVIVAAVGEASESSGESSSITNIDFPDVQRNLLKALMATGKPVVMVLFTGRPLAINWEKENVPSILNVWFPGSEGGLAIADVLFGATVPSGRLSVTFPQNTGQIPIYYSQLNTGRPLQTGSWFQKFKSNYLDVSNEPLYPFGYGLGYSSIEYGKMQLDKTELVNDELLKVSVEVSNTGIYSAKEVVQLYIRDMVGTISRPVKQLKGFEKIELAPGESSTVTFEVSTELLKFYNGQLNYDWEPGAFQIMVGPNSSELQSQSIYWSK